MFDFSRASRMFVCPVCLCFLRISPPQLVRLRGRTGPCAAARMHRARSSAAPHCCFAGTLARYAGATALPPRFDLFRTLAVGPPARLYRTTTLSILSVGRLRRVRPLASPRAASRSLSVAASLRVLSSSWRPKGTPNSFFSPPPYFSAALRLDRCVC